MQVRLLVVLAGVVGGMMGCAVDGSTVTGGPAAPDAPVVLPPGDASTADAGAGPADASGGPAGVDAAAPDAGGGHGGADAALPDAGGAGTVERVFYVANDDGSLYAYRQGTWEQLAHWTGLPIQSGVRGIDVDPATGALYLAHGGDGAGNGTGGLLAWSLGQARVLYNVSLGYGVDQLSYGDGKIYMPEGELTNSTRWHVLDAATGAALGSEAGGAYPHNTIYRNGHRYYGGRQANRLTIVGIGAGSVGPSPSSTAGVRPFTVNAAETRVWLTWSKYRGFSVGDVQTGALLKSVSFGALPGGFSQTTASHGISLAPDGAEVYVLDLVTDSVRVYDGTDDPHLLATIALPHGLYGGTESPCAYDCDKVGWLLHSRDGAYVYVGDSGDVIDTKTRTVVAFLPPLRQSRHGFIEVDWSSWPSGTPVATTTHFGLGY
jgi:hypothetical protein